MEKNSCTNCGHRKVCRHYDALVKFANGNVIDFGEQRILEICGTHCNKYQPEEVENARPKNMQAPMENDS